MKKTLLLQTALVAAAGLFMADVANAQVKAEPLAVTVGGFFTQFIKFQDKDLSPGQPNEHATAFASDAEIYFNVRGVLDNGTVLGAQVQLEASSFGDQIDERYMFAEHREIGRAEIGSTDRVSGKMLYFAPNSLPGHATQSSFSEYAAANGGISMWFDANGHDNEGINLYTASNRYFGSKAGKGLQLGVSYVPDGCQDRDGGGTCGAVNFGTTADTNQISKQYVVAANYLESFGPIDLALYGAWQNHDVENVNNGRHDSWQAGAQFAWNLGGGSALQFGGGYSDEEVGTGGATGVVAAEKWNAGVRYLTNGAAPGSVGIGIEYFKRDRDLLAFAGDYETEYYHLGLTYQLATGVLTFAGVGVSDQTAPAGFTLSAVNNDQTFGVVGIGLTF